MREDVRRWTSFTWFRTGLLVGSYVIIVMNLQVIRKVWDSWLHGVKRSGWRVLAMDYPTELQVSWSTACFSLPR
jgi:hypothetical protein